MDKTQYFQRQEIHGDFSYGLAVLINTGYTNLTVEDAAKRLQIEFAALSQVYFKNIDFKRKEEIDRFIQQNKENI